MARNIYGNVLNTTSQIAQQYNPNVQVSTPVVPPVEQQQPVEQPAAPPTIANIVKRNFFRVDPTAQQAQVVGASPISEQQRAQQVQQMQIDAARNQAAQETQVAQENQNQQTQIASMDDLARAMGYTSPQEEEKIRKASLTNQKIMAVADALRHIGNIANTVHYAPAQQFNNPVLEEEARYQKGKALRDKANYTYLNYQQQKAIQDARARQMEAQAAYQQESLGIRKAEHQRLVDAQKLARQKQDFYEKLKQEQYELDKAYKEHKMTWAEYDSKTRRISADAAWLRADKYVPGGSGGVGGYTTTETTRVIRDENGRETGREKVKTRTGAGGTTKTVQSQSTNKYGGVKHGGSGGGKEKEKENKFGVKPAK